MRAKYLLPCSCGQKLPVEAGQAGQELRCRCGATVEVPTMKGLAQLERVRTEPAVRGGRPKWGVAHRLVLLGSLIALVGVGMGAYFYSIRPSPPSFEHLGPYDVWAWWQQLREGPRGRFDWERRYEQKRDWYRRWMITAGVVTAAGLLTVFSSLMVPKPQGGRPSRRKRRSGQGARR